MPLTSKPSPNIDRPLNKSSHSPDSISDEVAPYEFVSGMTEKSIAVLITYLTGTSRTDSFVKMYTLFGKEVLLFLSMFQGTILRIPRLKYLTKVKVYCKIYLYVKNHNYTEEAYKEAAELFCKRTIHIQAIVRKVEKELAKIKNGEIEYPTQRGVNDVVTEFKDTEGNFSDEEIDADSDA